MPTDVDLDGLDSLLDNGAQLVEVLPRDEYDEEHLPSAVNIPLRELTAESVTRRCLTKTQELWLPTS